eukprot:804104-Rhodomonas_salina.1
MDISMDGTEEGTKEGTKEGSKDDAEKVTAGAALSAAVRALRSESARAVAASLGLTAAESQDLVRDGIEMTCGSSELCDVRELPCYAMSGTEIAYGTQLCDKANAIFNGDLTQCTVSAYRRPVRCLVLTQRTRLRSCCAMAGIDVAGHVASVRDLARRATDPLRDIPY